ncbi:MAG: glycoside hydrolase family 140 protein [Bacteroidota bacterium]
MKKILLIIFLGAFFYPKAQMQLLKIAPNKRCFVTADGKPFFWLGDTGWLLFVKTKREQAIQYLDDRKAKGYNVIQVMVVHDLDLGVNVYGDSALHNKDVSQPITTPGKNFAKAAEYDFWDNVDFVIDEAAKRGIYMALVPVWGGNIKRVSVKQATDYASFLAKRYRNKTNIIWLNGGDIKGGDALDKWNAIGKTLRTIDKNHLITFHPRGRNSSSEWFHNASWLDFNMFQSGHRSYAQDTSANEKLHYGEDNWRYVNYDYKLKPTKPTLDGEPSYEDIPYGLHDGKEPYWQDYEIRRYAYWSVFAGACGFTYGHNSVMQYYTPGDSGISFFPKIIWQDGLAAPGAGQMQYLKKLMLSKSYFDRVPDQSMIVDNGEKYDRILATRGKDYALIYTYTGRNFKVKMGKIEGKKVMVSLLNPRTGVLSKYNLFDNTGVIDIKLSGEAKPGNDWVFVFQKFR